MEKRKEKTPEGNRILDKPRNEKNAKEFRATLDVPLTQVLTTAHNRQVHKEAAISLEMRERTRR